MTQRFLPAFAALLELVLVACGKPHLSAASAGLPPGESANAVGDASFAKSSVSEVASTPDSMIPGVAMHSQMVKLANARNFALRLPAALTIQPAFEGFKRPRFMARSPNGRLFVTDLINMSDNHVGIIYALGGYNASTHEFRSRVRYLTNLRNPNSIAFHQDEGRWFLYVALTDKLVRYRYEPARDAPIGDPETLATFPDYGLNYKYGGWHLTRTVTFGGDGTLYVSAGSSCNACEEKEEVRATVQTMTAAGDGKRFFARGLRNSVGLKWSHGTLYATDMGADHLGDDAPDERLFALSEGKNYGWPYCYDDHGRVKPDPQFAASDAGFDCAMVPAPFASFPAHAAPLGLEYFGDDAPLASLRDSFVVALHGSTKKSIAHGYRLVQVRAGRPPQDLITGFLQDGEIHGRPVDVLTWSDGFLVSDDFAGVLYHVGRAEPAN